MKISNNALNFLLAQYRAIFKRAYVKGIASAVLLTAGLAMGQANAQVSDQLLQNLDNLPTSGTITITGVQYEGAQDGKYTKIQSIGGSQENFNGELIIESGTASTSNGNFIASNTAGATSTLAGQQGKLTIAIKPSGTAKTDGLQISGNSGDVSIDLYTIDVQNGLLKITDASVGSGNATVEANIINIGTDNGDGYLTLSSTSTNKAVVLGRDDSQSGDTASTITVGKNGILTMQGLGSSGATIQGASLTLNDGAVMLTDTGVNNIVKTENFTIESNAYKVIQDTDAEVSETFTGKTGTVNGNVLVGQSGTWVIGQGMDGTAAIGTTVTFNSGSNLQISGTLSVAGGKVVINNGTNLNAVVEATTDKGTISVTAEDDPDSSGTLVIGAETLKNFLAADNLFNNIIPNDETDKEGDYTLGEEQTKDFKGALILSGGVLQINSPSQIELNKDFSFSGTNTAKAGYISVSGGAKIIADNVLLSDKLNDLSASDDKLLLEVNSLKLTDDAEKLGFSGATTHDLIVQGTNGDAFKLQDTITLKATNRDVTRDVTLDDNFVEVAENGTITGALNVSGGTLNVEAGHYTTKDNLTIDHGTLAITAIAGKESGDYYVNGLAADLTVDGGTFALTKSNMTSPTVTITGDQGATAFLDLRKAGTVNWGASGVDATITISGNPADISATEEAGQGILYVRGDQFENYLDNTESSAKIGLGSGGVLFVDGSTTSLNEVDVARFASGGALTSNKVTFTGAGTFETNVPLDLAINQTTTNKYLAIGAGTIKAPSIELNYKADDKDEDTVFVISGGTLEVASSLTSSVGMVSFVKNSSDVGKLKLDGQGAVGVDTTFSGTDSELEVAHGTWTAQNAFFDGGAKFTVGGADDIASLTLDNINVTGASASGSVNSGSSLTVDTMQTDGATAPAFSIYGNMTINGRNNIVESGDNADIDVVADNADTTGINLSGAQFTVSGSEAQLTIGATATAALVDFTTNAKDVVDAALDDATYTLEDFATLRLEFADNVTLTAAQAKQLKGELFTNGEVGEGIINVGGAKLDIDWEEGSNNQIATWANVKDFAEIESVTSDELKQALIIDIDEAVAGHYGAMQVAANNALSVNGVLGLHQAWDGYFVFSGDVNGNKTEEDVSIQNGSLLLAGAGKIGDISAHNSDVTIAQGAVAGTTEVLGNITGAKTLDVGNNTTVTGNVSAQTLELADNTSLSNGTSDMTLGTAAVGTGAQLATTNLTLTGAEANDWIEGTVNVDSEFKVNAGTVVIADGAISAQTTVLGNNVTLQVGRYAAEVDNPSTTDINEAESNSGTFETTSLDLNGGLLIVDPEYNKATALASIRNFAGVTDQEYTDHSLVGTANGSIFVGQNSALGIGTENLDALRQAIARYQTNGSLSDAADRLGAIVYLDGVASIEDNRGVVMTNKSLEDFVKYYKDTNGTNSISTTSPVIGDAFFFGDGTALMATADAIKAAHNDGTALVTFEGQNGKLVADGGEILVSGDLRGNTEYTLFADAGGTGDDNGTDVHINDIKGQAVTEKGKGIAVTTENGFLVGELLDGTGGRVTLGLAGDARARMSGASDPVYDTLVTYFKGYKVVGMDDQNNEIHDNLYDGYKDGPNDPTTGQPTQVKDTNYSNYFLAGALAQGNGAAAEAAARLGVYGGAPQAAIKAGQSSTDAIAARFGIGSAISNLTVAGNTQGAALWLAPVYKTSDSDGFDAQGVDYGVNVDLYGVALGADYTLANGISFGAMFNVGSGEVDGEGAASPVSNDFDYYGFGAYAGYTMGQFSVVGDISYTVADNEVEASTSVDHIGAQMDSTNLSLGVTGKYELSFNGVNVTPHVGLRYSNIDLDDYTIDGEEVVASADSDKLNLFSIPVGVTIAKEFKGESWTVAPSFDLTLTGQFGDDEFDGSVSWAGVSNLNTDTTTEVIDNFTYGATLGVEAQSVGGVALGINFGYTGSSNVDEFGVNANARFVF